MNSISRVAAGRKTGRGRASPALPPTAAMVDLTDRGGIWPGVAENEVRRDHGRLRRLPIIQAIGTLIMGVRLFGWPSQTRDSAMAVTTAEDFFSIIEKSGLLTLSQVAHARDAADRTDNAQATAWRLVNQELISRWQASQLLAGRYAFHLGKYRLIEPLGRGGMGSVFLGHHVTMHRRVALKVHSRRAAEDPNSLERLLAEARAVASLDHPNIIRAYNVDNDGDHYYFVMEYVEGVDLERLVRSDGPLDDDRAMDYIRQAADGLDHAHQRNMVHGDVKPSNLLVNLQGVIKILDLGLARFAGDEEFGTGGGDRAILGSVDYLAPEQAIESPDRDHRADIYSLGCTLYFLLTGHPPFAQGTLAERISQASNAGAARPARRVSGGIGRVGGRLPQDDGKAARRPLCNGRRSEPSAGPIASEDAGTPACRCSAMTKLLDELAEEESRQHKEESKPVVRSWRRLGILVLVLLALVELVAFLFVTLGH